MHLFVVIFLLLRSDHVNSRWGGNDDYLSGTFDPNINCKNPIAMKQLAEEDKCEAVNGTSLNKMWEDCKARLVPKLAQTCNPRSIEKVS